MPSQGWLTRSTVILVIVVLVWLASATAADVPRDVTLSTTAPRSPTPIEDDALLNDIAFVSTRVGWAVGDHGVIWHTDDAGETWSLQSTPTRSPLYSACFLTDRVGWAAGGRTVPFTRTGEGVLLATNDGGQTWQELRTAAFPRLHFVKFFSPDEGVVAGEATATHPSGLLVTRDGGRTWQDVPARGEEASSWRAADFSRLDRGAVVGQRGQSRLIDAGGLSAPQRSDWGLRGLHDIVLKPGGLAWMVGDGGLVMRSTNSGLAWQAPAGELPEELRDLFDFRAVAVRVPASGGRPPPGDPPSDAQPGGLRPPLADVRDGSRELVWLSGDPGSVIWHSADGGRTWERQRTGQTLPLRAIAFASDKVGWAAGACGVILRTTDGGRTWENVHGETRRAALVAFPTEAQRTSLPLVAQLGGELGYRSLTCVLARQDVGDGRRSVADLDIQLHEAVTTVGGSCSQIAWQLPITIPGIDRNTAKLVADWNYRTEGRLSEVLVGQLVKLFRTWRPTVVVIDRPSEHDALTKIINQAIGKAVANASDPTRFPDQLQIAGLAPWSVYRIFERLSAGSAGPVSIDPHQFLPHLGQTGSAAAANASGKLFNRPESSFARESYRLVIDKSDKPISVVTDFFTAIPIGTGSDARRELPPLHDLDLDQQQKLARQQRNMQAYLDRFLDDPQHAGNLLAQTQDVIGHLPPEHAAWQLAQIAELHRRNGHWELAELTLIELMERYPDHPAAQRAMQTMIQAWIGLEPCWQRLRTSTVSKIQVVGDPTSAAKQIAQARAKLKLANDSANSSNDIQSDGSEGKLSVTPGDAESETGVRIAGYAVATQVDDRTRQWWKLAERWAKRLQEHQPAIYSVPEIQFPLAAMYRQRGLDVELRTALSRFANQVVSRDPNPWTRCAQTELALLYPTPLSPPRRFAACRIADAKPMLDGILSDPCWDSADELPLMATPTDRAAGNDHSFAMLCRDREYLYFAARLVRHPDAPTDTPQRGPRPRDAELADFDRVSLVLDVDRDYATYYQFTIDQRGWTADDCWGDPTWNPRWFVAASANETHWNIEAAIPLSELTPRSPLHREVWNVGIIRTIPAVKQETWSHPATPNPQPETFGLVRFE